MLTKFVAAIAAKAVLEAVIIDKLPSESSDNSLRSVTDSSESVMSCYRRVNFTQVYEKSKLNYLGSSEAYLFTNDHSKVWEQHFIVTTPS